MSLHGTFNWTPENVEVLRNFRKSGLSSAAIAHEMHITRNSVGGKLARLGIPAPVIIAMAKKVPVRRPSKARAKPVVILQLSKSTPPMVIPPAPPSQSSKPVSILDAKPWQCRSVLDRRDERGRHSLAMFCGGQKTAGSSYCASHARLYRQPPKEISRGQTSEHE